MWNFNFHVYIITNKNNTVLYIGVTNDLKHRIYQHRAKENPGFTSKYNLYKLVYYEHFTDINHAIDREKQLKKWKRKWKEELIKRMNPEWKDLYDEIDE
jgi:putative endonuclease